MKKIFIVLAIAVAASSCRIFIKPSQRAVGNNDGAAWNLDKTSGIVRLPQYVDDSGNVGGFFWSTYDATRRSSFINIKNDTLQVLAEVQPDAAVELARSLQASLAASGKGVKVDASLATQTVQSIATLGSRTAAVNIQRDALYHIAQNSINCHCSPDNAALMTIVFNNTREMAIAESRSQAEIESAKAQQKVSEAEMERAKYEWKMDSLYYAMKIDSIKNNKEKKKADTATTDTASSGKQKSNSTGKTKTKTKATSKTGKQAGTEKDAAKKNNE